MWIVQVVGATKYVGHPRTQAQQMTVVMQRDGYVTAQDVLNLGSMATPGNRGRLWTFSLSPVNARILSKHNIPVEEAQQMVNEALETARWLNQAVNCKSKLKHFLLSPDDPYVLDKLHSLAPKGAKKEEKLMEIKNGTRPAESEKKARSRPRIQRMMTLIKILGGEYTMTLHKGMVLAFGPSTIRLMSPCATRLVSGIAVLTRDGRT